MKHFYTFLLLLFTNYAAAQKPLVLIEEFTNTGCNPCAAWSPTLDQVINERLGDCIAIKYHSVYPDNGDEFYNYDPSAQQSRIDFYGVDGVPATYVNGTVIGERTYEMMNTAIDHFLSQPARYVLSVSKTIVNHQLSVNVAVTPQGSEDPSHLRLFVAAIEEYLIPTRPCNNGETELQYTLRKLLTGGEGMEMGDAWEAGTSHSYDFSWDIDFMNDERQLGVVAFVQDMETKEILGTAYCEPGSEQENHPTLMRLTDTPDLICVSNYYGQVIFRNSGSNTLTSAQMNVEVNGAVKQYPWSGHLQYLERDTLAFADFRDFPLSASENQVKIWMSDINGTESVSNTLTSQFENSVQAAYSVQLRLYTDKKPEETTWKVYNSAGDVVREGGPYEGARKLYTENLELTEDDCYLLELEDAGGDGIKGSYGNGYYQLYQVSADGKTSRLTQGDYTGSVCDVYFHLTGTPKSKKRLVLFEEFTNTSCDPCSDFSPSLDKTINERMGDMVAVTYHINFPSNRDPFYLANPDDAMARAGYYDVTGVPSLRVDGERAGAHGFEDQLDSYIDIAGAVAPQVDLDAEASLTDGQLTVSVSVTPENIADGSDLRLHVAVVEEQVVWDEPAPNGEKSWNYVMRALLPTAEGEVLPADLPLTVPTRYEYSWPVANFYDETELGIVTFVQDNTTKKVLGACYTPRPTGSKQAAKILSLLHLPDRICQPQFTCDLRVRNTGREPLTSATINVRINGALQSTPWSGRMAYLDIDTLRTPLFNDFTLSEREPQRGGNMAVRPERHCRGERAQDPHHGQCPQGPKRRAPHPDDRQRPRGDHLEGVQLARRRGVRGRSLHREARKKHVTDLPLTTDDCYLLEFCDAGGNGITGENGRGYYMLHEVNADGQTRLLVQADYTGSSHQVYFSLQHAQQLGIEPATAEQESTPQRYDLQGRVRHRRHHGHLHRKREEENKPINKNL